MVGGNEFPPVIFLQSTCWRTLNKLRVVTLMFKQKLLCRKERILLYKQQVSEKPAIQRLVTSVQESLKKLAERNCVEVCVLTTSSSGVAFSQRIAVLILLKDVRQWVGAWLSRFGSTALRNLTYNDVARLKFGELAGFPASPHFQNCKYLIPLGVPWKGGPFRGLC